MRLGRKMYFEAISYMAGAILGIGVLSVAFAHAPVLTVCLLFVALGFAAWRGLKSLRAPRPTD